LLVFDDDLRTRFPTPLERVEIFSDRAAAAMIFAIRQLIRETSRGEHD